MHPVYPAAEKSIFRRWINVSFVIDGSATIVQPICVRDIRALMATFARLACEKYAAKAET